MSGGRTQTPTFIGLPPPQADPMTPDLPGTPTSTTTSMSELSTVAIKDGHRGHLHHHSNPMDAERADRISRLAGLDRLHPRQQPSTTSNFGSSTGQHPLAQAYFDGNNVPQITRERSTVGSASATAEGTAEGSVGGRTTWASGSDVYDPDKMSESNADMESNTDMQSMSGFSDEGTPSLVGFGEGARTPARQLSSYGSPPGHQHKTSNTPRQGVVGSMAAGTMTPQSAIEAQRLEARNLDGMTYDRDGMDTTNRTPPPVQD
ncbi:hypothetical protein BT63DRAFT_457608 [Microthyrium microscopicum]|uniref:Uncharacterized protein n=1 Tax=Microthyrium microscopicum TaxID=703497 RepID=A0A6A6U4U3_9PEZI|nr:hypothetical protein BT63DRAFT_457608 [Microthyrium microscopicum]